MTNTPFSKRVEIVSDFYMHYGYDYEELLATFDLGFPLAVAVAQGGIDKLTDKGIEWIDQTFIGILDQLELDIYGDYDSVDEILELANEQGE